MAALSQWLLETRKIQMKKYTRISMKSMIQMITVCTIAVSSATFSSAQGSDGNAGASRNWSLGVGGVTGMQPVYDGSDEMKPALLPIIEAAWHTQYVDVFASIPNDGLGLRFKEENVTGLSLALGVNFGEPRDRDADKVKKFLQGTAELVNDYQLFTSLTLPLPLGELSSTLRWFPVEAEYDGQPDTEYDGLRGELTFKTGLSLTQRLLLLAEVGATWMDDEYAQAYHGVQYATSELERFSAEGGLRDINASLQMGYLFNQHLMAIVRGDAALLLNDAADSPLTKNEFQPRLAVGVMYNF